MLQGGEHVVREDMLWDFPKSSVAPIGGRISE